MAPLPLRKCRPSCAAEAGNSSGGLTTLAAICQASSLLNIFTDERCVVERGRKSHQLSGGADCPSVLQPGPPFAGQPPPTAAGTTML
jgi:hypothetical protein